MNPPSLDDVCIPNHSLIGYIDVSNNQNSKINESLSDLQKKHVFIVYQRNLLVENGLRSFIYLPSKWISDATDSLNQGSPLRCLHSPLCKGPHKEQLRFVFDHLSSDWIQAWIGLGDIQSENANESVRKVQEAQMKCTLESLCGVLGCKDHPVQVNRTKYDLAKCLESLTPPIPKDLVGETGGLFHPLLRFSREYTNRFFSLLDAFAVRRMDLVCRTYRAYNYCPGFQTIHLLPHQRAALAWMLKKENIGPELDEIHLDKNKNKNSYHPCRTSFTCYDGKKIVFDALECAVLPCGLHNMVQPVCGGLFCDDPGLGKTSKCFTSF